jgi:branched-subunit amino acid transport protein
MTLRILILCTILTGFSRILGLTPIVSLPLPQKAQQRR